MFVVVDRVVDHHCMTFTDLIGSVLILDIDIACCQDINNSLI
jgi:hypothetical protein